MSPHTKNNKSQWRVRSGVNPNLNENEMTESMGVFSSRPNHPKNVSHQPVHETAEIPSGPEVAQQQSDTQHLSLGLVPQEELVQFHDWLLGADFSSIESYPQEASPVSLSTNTPQYIFSPTPFGGFGNTIGQMHGSSGVECPTNDYDAPVPSAFNESHMSRSNSNGMTDPVDAPSRRFDDQLKQLTKVDRQRNYDCLKKNCPIFAEFLEIRLPNARTELKNSSKLPIRPYMRVNDLIEHHTREGEKKKRERDGSDDESRPAKRPRPTASAIDDAPVTRPRPTSRAPARY